MKQIILASTSPRRRELLENIGLKFERKTPSFDESTFILSPSPSSVTKSALLKAKSIAKTITTSALVIGADTVVVADDIILGKPKDEDEAFLMMKLLAGRQHYVITGVAVIDVENNIERTDYAITYVTFNNLSDDDIRSYIKDKHPLDKAGAYGIQELPDNFVKSYEGEFDNVVGLPTKILIKMLSEMNN